MNKKHKQPEPIGVLKRTKMIPAENAVTFEFWNGLIWVSDPADAMKFRTAVELGKYLKKHSDWFPAFPEPSNYSTYSGVTLDNAIEDFQNYMKQRGDSK